MLLIYFSGFIASLILVLISGYSLITGQDLNAVVLIMIPIVVILLAIATFLKGK